jgi:hypothetical protein
MSVEPQGPFLDHCPLIPNALRCAAREPSAERKEAFLLPTRHLCLSACYARRQHAGLLSTRPAEAGLALCEFQRLRLPVEWEFQRLRLPVEWEFQRLRLPVEWE